MRSRIVLLPLIVLGALGLAGPAQAHNFLVESNPAADATISEVPDRFSVTTNEALLDLSGEGNGFAIQVTDAAGRFYGDGCPVVDGSSLSMGATLGEPGPYRFTWQLVSADGHTVSGEFAFTWAPAADAVITEGLDAAPVCGQAGVDATPTASPSAEPTAEPSATPSAVPIAQPVAQPVDLSTVLWIGGAVLAVLVAGGITLLVVSRRKP